DDDESSPITTRTVPTGTSSPSSTMIRATLPAAGDGISTVALSVWISTSGSSSAISCPSSTSQRATSPSVRPSPRSGSLNSYATSGLPAFVAGSPAREKQAAEGRRERSYPEDTGATEDAGQRRFAAAGGR